MNAQRIQQLSSKYGCAAFVASTVPNVYYSTGVLSLGQKFILGTKVFSIVIPGDPPRVALVAPVGEADLAIEEAREGVNIWPYGHFVIEGQDIGKAGTDGCLSRVLSSSKPMPPVDVLVQALQELGLQGQTVVVDEGGFTPDEWQRFAGTFAGNVVPGFAIWREIRMVKTTSEIRHLKRAAEITAAAISQALSEVHEGMTEKELVAVYEKYLLDNGAYPAISVILFGEHSAYPNGVPGNRRLQRGDIIRFDSGCVYNNYYADLARNALFGLPEPEIQGKVSTYHAAMLKGVQAGINALRPGARADEVFQLIMNTVHENGVPHYQRTHCGHGIGAELYDQPIIAPGNKTILEAGMVFCVETPYYELGLGGIQVEDTVVINEEGAEYLSPPSSVLSVL